MAVCTLHFHGEAINKASSMNVILPQQSAHRGPFPVLYLLHGLSDDHTIWCRRTSVERYVQDLPLVVVMPDGGRGFYTDAVTGLAYERHIMEDVIGTVERLFQVRTDRAGRAIGGLSMGGYGSLKLALKYPDVFGSVVAHSGVYDMARLITPDTQRHIQTRAIFGPDAVGGDNDVFALAQRLDPAQAPAIRVDCGVDDGLIADNRALHAHLDALGIAHEYAEYPGAHTWAYWDEHIQEAIAFHWRTLGAHSD
jgi:S-formylglutathione hydrolase FrmB